jgi:flagellar biosynthetic protein FliQ
MVGAASLDSLTELAQQGLLIAALVSLPVLLVSAVVGLVSAMLQATTQLEDALLTHLPRLLLVGLTLIWLGPWMGRTLSAYAARAFSGG